MPIPTPAPPVKREEPMEPLNHDGEPLHTGDDERIDLVTSILAGCDECHDEDLDWSDVILGIREDCQKLDALLIQTINREREREALLLQRAQEIAELKARNELESCPSLMCPFEKRVLELEALLTARAQEIEQVKAERDIELERATHYREQWQRAEAAIASRIFPKADAALVSRAPQPEQDAPPAD
jgi:hypothetical protein